MHGARELMRMGKKQCGKTAVEEADACMHAFIRTGGMKKQRLFDISNVSNIRLLGGHSLKRTSCSICRR